MLYGKQRGSYQNNLQRYFNGEEFRGQCTYAISLNDIPEISEEQIQRQLDYEAWIWEREKYVVEFYDKHTADGSITDEDYLAIAGESGLSGSNLA